VHSPCAARRPRLKNPPFRHRRCRAAGPAVGAVRGHRGRSRPQRRLSARELRGVAGQRPHRPGRARGAWRRQRHAGDGAARDRGRGARRAGHGADPHDDLPAAPCAHARRQPLAAAAARTRGARCGGARCAHQRAARGARARFALARRPAIDRRTARRQRLDDRRPQALHHWHRGPDMARRVGTHRRGDAAHRRVPGAAQRPRRARDRQLGPPGPARLGQPRSDLRERRDRPGPRGRPAHAGRLGARCRQPDRHRRARHPAGLDGRAARQPLRRGGAGRARLAGGLFEPARARQPGRAAREPAARAGACRRDRGAAAHQPRAARRRGLGRRQRPRAAGHRQRPPQVHGDEQRDPRGRACAAAERQPRPHAAEPAGAPLPRRAVQPHPHAAERCDPGRRGQARAAAGGSAA
jgi:hypothetical protein